MLRNNSKTFAAATAVIQGDTVIVTSPGAKPPIAVRYAWAGWPNATLANKEGLPATPFRFPPPLPGSP